MRPRKRLIILFLLPASLLYLVFFLLPAAQSFYYSVFDFSGFQASMKFVGVQNYVQLWSDDTFRQSLRNTVVLMFIGGLATFALAFLLTIMADSGIRGKKVFRALIFLPNVVAPIALVNLWSFAIYHPKMGVVPNALKVVGLEEWSKFPFLSTNNIFSAMLMALIWISAGYYLVLLLAGVDKIPIELYECARLEGANLFQMFTKITVPLIWDVITVGLVLWTVSAIKVFEFPFAFMGANVTPQLYTMAVYLFIMGFGKRDPIWRLGYASAIGVVMLFVVILAALVLMRITRRETVEY